MKKRKWWPIVLALLVTAAVAAGVLFALNSDSGPNYSTTEVSSQTIEVSVAANGQLVDEVSYGLAAGLEPQPISIAANAFAQPVILQSLPGYTVKKVLVAIGDRVSKNQRLIRLENPLGEIEILKAPRDGTVRELRAVEGSTASGQLISIGTGRLLSIVQVSEYDIADISIGQAARVNIDALGQEFDAVVTQIGQLADSSTGVKRYSVLLELSELTETARLGMSTNAKIITLTKENVLAIPANAIANLEGKNVVAVLRGDEVIALEVQIGTVGDTLVEIVSGLSGGEMVIVGQIGQIPEVNQNFGPPAGVRSGGSSN
jgi:multidrug efflux pump subunit AcrA (membrane-fusion protein)